MIRACARWVGQIILFLYRILYYSRLPTLLQTSISVFATATAIFKRLRYAHDIVGGGDYRVVCGDVPFRKYAGKTTFDGFVRITTPETVSHYIEVIIL